MQLDGKESGANKRLQEKYRVFRLPGSTKSSRGLFQNRMAKKKNFTNSDTRSMGVFLLDGLYDCNRKVQ